MPPDTAFTRMFGCRYPLQLAGMGGFPSPELAVAVSAAGGLGMLSGALPPRDLERQLDAVPPEVPVGVSFLMPFLDVGAAEDAAGRCALVEFFWDEPSPQLVDLVHAGGARCSWQVGSLDEALAAVDAGCDLVVAQGVEAGGHVRGTTPALELVAAVCDAIDVPVVAAGGFGDAKRIASALGLGSAAVRVGTRFLAATESAAHPDYIDRLVGANADDTVLTTAFGIGWPDAPHRLLRSCLEATEALGPTHAWTPDWPAADYVGDVEARPLYAGMSVDFVTKRQSAAEIVAELMTES